MDSESASPVSTDQPLEVRLARREEMRRWRTLMHRHHYLDFDRIIGDALYYIATIGQQWVALIG